MAITEASRHQLISKLEDILGREDAFVLVEHLPPVGWADVATKRDLDLLETRLRLDFRLEFGAFKDELHADRRAAQRQLIFVLIVAVVGLVVSMAGLG